MSDYAPNLCYIRIDKLTIMLSVKPSKSCSYVSLRKTGEMGNHNADLEAKLKKDRAKLKKIQGGQSVPI